MISDETQREIDRLAGEMAARFTPPEYIPGCKVLSVADKDQYATDNGWIEALCGRHNQQRCRWMGQLPSVAVNDFVDVQYFPNIRHFTVFGQGGTSAAVSGGYLVTDGSRAGATGAAQDFGANGIDTDAIDSSAGSGIAVADDLLSAVSIQGIHDAPLVDSANASGVTSHFRDNDSSYPAGWTETTAAATTNTNTLYSYWYLIGTSTPTNWIYRIQTNITPGLASFQFGPIYFRNSAYGADLTYYFGMYRDNSGIDTTSFVRVALYWNSSSAIWQARGESSDGTTQTNGTYYNLMPSGGVPPQPLYIRVFFNQTINLCRLYIGYTQIADAQFLLSSTTKVMTMGQSWLQINQSRGAGLSDYLYIGSVDYLAGIS